MSLSRAHTRASYVFSFSSITSITIYVNYHADRELDSDRRRDRKVIVVIEERLFNGKICDFSHKFTIKRGHSEGLYPIIINSSSTRSRRVPVAWEITIVTSD